MKEITRLMVNEFRLKQLGFDFMGYKFNRKDQLSAHHLIIPKRNGGLLTRENTAILRQDTSHDYLHRIESVDYERFLSITSCLIDENILGRLDLESLRRIRDILEGFEREYSGKRTSKGKVLIKEDYIRGRVIK